MKHLNIQIGLTFLLLTALSTATVKAQNIEPASLLTPGSTLISEDDQDMMANWLGGALGEHQAELVFSFSDVDAGQGSFQANEFHALCDGRSHTLVVVKSPAGYTFGGYNEGTWSSTFQNLTNLNNNFLFSLDTDERYMAIPGEVHITNSITNLPKFGVDLAFGSAWDNVCNFQGSSYECPNAPNQCSAILNDGIFLPNLPFDYCIDLFQGEVEIWQLKTTGLSSRSLGDVGIDANNDGTIDYFGNCYAGDNDMFPGSEIFDSETDNLISSWLPSELEFEAELVFVADLNVSEGSLEEWIFLSEGLENTIIVMETADGLKFGGYNSGYWDDNFGVQTDLLDNFIFSLTYGTRHDAIPGENHITTGIQGPIFGGGDIYFVGSILGDVTLSNLGGSYECGIGNNTENECISYLGGDEEFELKRFEFWQLKDSGTKVLSVVDANNNGVCDHLEINNSCPGDFDGNQVITSADLTGFLSVFGTECSN